jgi:hypothetical protein
MFLEPDVCYLSPLKVPQAPERFNHWLSFEESLGTQQKFGEKKKITAWWSRANTELVLLKFH